MKEPIQFIMNDQQAEALDPPISFCTAREMLAKAVNNVRAQDERMRGFHKFRLPGTSTADAEAFVHTMRVYLSRARSQLTAAQRPFKRFKIFAHYESERAHDCVLVTLEFVPQGMRQQATERKRQLTEIHDLI